MHTLIDKRLFINVTSPQKRSGMAHLVEGFDSFIYTSMRLFANEMNYTMAGMPMPLSS